MFKVNNRNTKQGVNYVQSKQRQQNDVFDVLTFSVSIFNFEQVNVGWQFTIFLQAKSHSNIF